MVFKWSHKTICSNTDDLCLESSVQTMWFEFAKIKGTKIILHVKSPIFRAAKFKGFSVIWFTELLLKPRNAQLLQ